MNIFNFKKIASLKRMLFFFMGIFLQIVSISSTSLCQQINFHSPQNIKSFADFLFCDKDYLRAIYEYEKYLSFIDDDTIQFKIAISYSSINDQIDAVEKFKTIKITSPLYEESKIELLKSLYLLNVNSQYFTYADEIIESKSRYSINAEKIKNTSRLLLNHELPDKQIFLFPFDENEKKTLSNFYDRKTNPSYKSGIIAGILSTIIPGAGKIYTKDYSDGITAFLLTGLFTYLAYTNFEHNHSERAWIFTAAGVGFYTGNIYGSIASAQIFNAKINFEFDEGVKLFLQEKNYFTPVYDFCK
ncbi:MAG TPA: hypothetical protein DHV28_02700 [Ignavibacteriales bacterium]|nr:hypothetical protein [Ignavibacteriales bacterium]